MLIKINYILNIPVTDTEEYLAGDVDRNMFVLSEVFHHLFNTEVASSNIFSPGSSLSLQQDQLSSN